MTPFLLSLLKDPISGESLTLLDEKYDNNGNIISGVLKATSGETYQIINGIPRFLNYTPVETVSSFGEQWNYFNFVQFKNQWLNHTVKNTWGNTTIFKDKIIIDAGGGSGAQGKWFLEYGAKHVIILDLSQSLDDVAKRNLIDSDPSKYDLVQCSIDNPPLKDNSANGLVYCHNVIQHTPSVEKTLNSLYKILSSEGELAFNCYPLNDKGFFRWIRFHLFYKNIRRILKGLSFKKRLNYARIVALLRLFPIFGVFLEKSNFVLQGDVPQISGEKYLENLKRRYKSALVNTFDYYGAHSFQWHLSDKEVKRLLNNLNPKPSKIKNISKYFKRPQPIGCALRVIK